MIRILLKGVAAVAVTGMLSGCGFFTNLDNSLNTSIEKQETRTATFVSDVCIAAEVDEGDGQADPAPQADAAAQADAAGQEGDADSQALIGPAIAGAALTSVVGNVIDLGVEKINEFNEDKSAGYIARGVGELASDDCITILRAQLSTSSDISKADADAVGLVLDSLKKIKVSAVPEFAVELRMENADSSKRAQKATSISRFIETAADGQQSTVSTKKISIRANYVLFRKSAAKTYPYNEKEVGIVLVLRSSPTDKDTQDDVVKDAEFVLPLDFGKLKPGQYYNEPNLFPETAMVLDVDPEKTKFNAYALVVEADDKSKVLEIIASALADSKETIVGEVKAKAKAKE